MQMRRTDMFLHREHPARAAAIRASQKKRLFVQEAMKCGALPTWDYGPPYDPDKAYMRGGIDPSTTATKQRGRFPFVPKAPPRYPRRGGKAARNVSRARRVSPGGPACATLRA